MEFDNNMKKGAIMNLLKSSLFKLSKMSLIVAAVLPAMVLSTTAESRSLVGLTFGTGLSLPQADLAAKDRFNVGAGMTRFQFGIDAYPHRQLSIGGFLLFDRFSTDAVNLAEYRSGSKGTGSVDVMVWDLGVPIKYYFRSQGNLRPFAKLWIGVSSVNLHGENYFGGTDPGASGMNWGLGSGLLYQLGAHSGLSMDITYNFTKAAKRGNSDSTARLDIGLLLHVLIG